MPIGRGQDWGEEVEAPEAMVTVTSDAALAAAIASDPSRPVLVRGGDVHRSLGAPSESRARVHRVPIDLVHVSGDGIDAVAVAHVVVRRPGLLGWWRGPITCVMNVDHHGAADVAPRAHPNDGRFDIVEVSASMPARARWQARRRLPTGTHVPHPDITVRRGADETLTFERPLTVWIDGVRRGRASSLRVVLVPDAAVVHA